MDRTVLITGAAGAIGSATAIALATQGHRVVGLDKLPVPPRSPVDGWIEHDLLDTAGTEKLLAESPLLRGLRHVVAIAGGATADELGRLDPADVPVDVFEGSVRLNLVAQYALVRSGVARALAEAKDGDRSVTLTSSINALRGYGMPGYSAAKAGLLGLVVALALPLGRRGVRINAVIPGTVLDQRSQDDANEPDALGRRLVAASASRRGTRPEDVADAVVALIGLEQMTGQHLVIDGGQTVTPFDRYPLA